MFTRFLTATAAGLLLATFVVQPTRANGAWGTSNHQELLTFTAAVALPGVVLAAGTYRFEVPDAGMPTGLVRVASRDGRKIYLTQYARIVEKPREVEAAHVTFAEAVQGAAPRVNTWFPAGEDSGRQFIYN